MIMATFCAHMYTQLYAMEVDKPHTYKIAVLVQATLIPIKKHL